MTEKTVDIWLPPQFKELFNPKWRNILYYGGRGSSKSHSIARALLIIGRQSRQRILCTREIQNSIEDSSFQLLKDIIDKYELSDYVYTKTNIVNTLTGTEFSFKGLKKGTTQSVKSLEGIDKVWVEEAQSVSEDSLDILSPTVRADGSQLIFSFNRMTELDPVYVKYVLNTPPNTYHRMVNYTDVINYGIFPEVLKNEMEYDRDNNPSLYAHKWLGEPMSEIDDAIISRTAVLNAMKRTVDDIGANEVGIDVARMGNDRTVITKRKGLAVKDIKTYSKLRTTEVCDKIELVVDYDKTVLVKIDDTGVGGGVTDEMMKRGYNVMPINFGSEPSDKDKYTNLISEAWFYLASIINQISLPMNSDLLMELSTRKWQIDSRGRRVVESKDNYKKRGYRSPDLADSVIIAFYEKSVISIDDFDL